MTSSSTSPLHSARRSPPTTSGTSLTGTWTGALNDNFILSFVAAAAEPGDAIEQSSGRTDTFWYGMIFAAYSF